MMSTLRRSRPRGVARLLRHAWWRPTVIAAALRLRKPYIDGKTRACTATRWKADGMRTKMSTIRCHILALPARLIPSIFGR